MKNTKAKYNPFQTQDYELIFFEKNGNKFDLSISIIIIAIILIFMCNISWLFSIPFVVILFFSLINTNIYKLHYSALTLIKKIIPNKIKANYNQNGTIVKLNEIIIKKEEKKNYTSKNKFNVEK